MLLMPVLETERLTVRPFAPADLDAAHQLFDHEMKAAHTGTEGAMTREQRARWLQWLLLQYEYLAWLYQPPYGERAVTLRQSGEIVGAVGNVPCLAPFGQIPALVGSRPASDSGLNVTEFGLYWAIAPAHRRRGYAVEAARALLDYAFGTLHLARVVATTDYDNEASIGVMRKLGMGIERNPLVTPPWLQIVGVLDRPLDVDNAAAPAVRATARA